jgi:hypothetical protein
MVMFFASRLARIRPDIIPQPINQIEERGNRNEGGMVEKETAEKEKARNRLKRETQQTHVIRMVVIMG